jgi:hypothetical protein
MSTAASAKCLGEDRCWINEIGGADIVGTAIER